MKTSRIILFIAIGILSIVFFYAMQGGQSIEDYAAELKKERDEKDHLMKSGADSPFKKSLDSFRGLRYFEPDLEYRLVADLQAIDDKKLITLPTSDGKEKRYREYGVASFVLKGTPCKLLILEIIDAGPYYGTLFLAFADETSARETYGAGRYLDLKKTAGAATITLDFNRAYNPYCAYSEAYSCPFPPRENVLTVAIPVGEKNYE